MPFTESILKERDASGVYFRRTVTTAEGAVVSDERVKTDPILAFTQPQTAVLDDVSLTATITIALQLIDFDGAPRDDSGVVHFRLRDRAVPDDEGIVFSRSLAAGQLALILEFATPSEFVITIEPPLVADLHFAEPIRVRVR